MTKQSFLTKLIAVILILCLGTVSSCKKENRWDCIKRTGPQTTDFRVLAPFTSIYLNNNVDVFITQGNSQEIKIVAGKNLISLIKTEVVNGELHISNENRCNWARSYKKGMISVYITMPTLTYLENDGSGNFKSLNTISCDNISMMTKESGDIELSLNATNLVYIACLGSSDITLHGQTSTLGIYHLSEGYLYCNDIKAESAWTESKASGNEYLNVTNSLKVNIDWAGNVYYSGNPPTITETIIGKGKLIHQD